jgi:hypothetical protein
MGRTVGLHATPIGRHLEEPCGQELWFCHLRRTGFGWEIGPPIRHGHPASRGQLNQEPRLIPFPEEVPYDTYLPTDPAVIPHNPHGSVDQGGRMWNKWCYI